MAGLPEHDSTISDLEVVWRRVPGWPDWTTHDENLGRRRPSSGAFEDDRDGSPMSMYLANGGNTIEEVLAGHPEFGLASLRVADLRVKGLSVVRRPEPGFPSHVEVVGPKKHNVRSFLAKASQWVVEPPVVE